MDATRLNHSPNGGSRLSVEVEVGALIDSWIYDVEGKRVVIMTYACSGERPLTLSHSDEHTAVAEFAPAELRRELIPEGYLRSIDASFRDRAFDGP